MGDADHLGGKAGVVNVLTRAAGALFLEGRAVVIELQRHADDVVACLVQQGRDHGGVHPARHGRYDPRSGRQADGRARRLDRSVHIGCGDVGDGADRVCQGGGVERHRGHIGAKARDFEAGVCNQVLVKMTTAAPVAGARPCAVVFGEKILGAVALDPRGAQTLHAPFVDRLLPGDEFLSR